MATNVEAEMVANVWKVLVAAGASVTAGEPSTGCVIVAAFFATAQLMSTAVPSSCHEVQSGMRRRVETDSGDSMSG